MHKRLTIESIRELATKKKGKFLSNEYKNVMTKYKWQCSEGHVWEAKPNSIQQGRWCSHCNKNAKLTIDHMHDIAAERGGKFLSEKYTNALTKCKWECGEGHVWETTYNKIQIGQWCPYCAGNLKSSIEVISELAKNKGGILLSKEYINACTKYKWQCGEGHVWETTPNSIKGGTWCPYCVGLAKLTIDHMHDIAAERGGKFLSKKYINSLQNYIWECDQNHIWKATYSNIKRGTWCPYCYSPSRGEEICRDIFFDIFKKPFIKCRPDFLKNKNNLELDGYCKELKIAFEYHGKQHFEPIEYFGGVKAFNSTQKRDKLKIELCKKADVKLVVISDFPRNFDLLLCRAIIEKSISGAKLKFYID